MAVDGDAGVEVADRGAGDGAAVLCLVCHLELHVLAIEAVLQLVHRIGDGGHGVAFEAVAEVLLGGDELDAEHAQVAPGEHGVLDVAEST
ncbi:hypothetical protein R0145_02510 [Raineyella sp. W15-4]|nr:hypothetical protein [Raineyella sp. W15-4]WOQ17604.1 hypothetical protein R0145_02510 [Raineyella sp. W15-4]